MTSNRSSLCGLRGPGAADLLRAHVVPPLAISPPRHPFGRAVLQKGFTLIELVFTLLILLIIAGVGSRFALQGIRAYSGGQDRGDAHAQARLAVERMAREVRAIRSATAADIPTMTATDLQFIDSLGQNVRFTWAANVLTRNGQTLAVNVAPFAFTYLQADGTTVAAAPANIWLIQIAFTVAQGGTSLPMRVKVHPRNF